MANGSLLLPRWVVPVEPAGKVLEDHAVAIRDGRIEAIAPTPDAALEASLAAGMRSAHGLIAIEFPSAYASDPADYLRKGLAIRDRYRDHELVSFCLAPHAPYSVSDATFRQVATLAAELDLPVHVHAHETADEIERSMSDHGVRPPERRRPSPRHRRHDRLDRARQGGGPGCRQHERARARALL